MTTKTFKRIVQVVGSFVITLMILFQFFVMWSIISSPFAQAFVLIGDIATLALGYWLFWGAGLFRDQ